MRTYRVSALPAVLQRPAIYLVRVPGSPETFEMYVVGRDGVARSQGVAQGAQGLSAYQVAVANGFVGTEAAWLASLRGPAGDDGADGDNGAPGLSAYQIAVAGGFVGSEAAWLASLRGLPGTDGDNGAPGLSAYEIALANGFVGSEAAWLASLQGPAAVQGSGDAVLDFGPAPGSNLAEVAVVGQADILPSAAIKVWMMAEGTPDHNAYEHRVILADAVHVSAGEVTNGVGFTVYAATQLRLTGTVKVRWSWSN